MKWPVYNLAKLYFHRTLKLINTVNLLELYNLKFFHSTFLFEFRLILSLQIMLVSVNTNTVHKNKGEKSSRFCFLALLSYSPDSFVDSVANKYSRYKIDFIIKRHVLIFQWSVSTFGTC